MIHSWKPPCGWRIRHLHKHHNPKPGNTMFRNYVLIALRNFWKHKLFSFINIVGLATGMAVCLLALIQVKDALEYDTFHPQAERTYRIITDVTSAQGDVTAVATSPLPLADALEKQYGFVEVNGPGVL